MQITDELWLCPHAAYGAASYQLGAVEAARRLVERAGGYDAILAKIVDAERERKDERADARKKAQARADKAVRYG